MSELLPKLLVTDHFPHGLKVDRAHHIGSLGNKLRIMIAKIHHDPVKEKIRLLKCSTKDYAFTSSEVLRQT